VNEAAKSLEDEIIANPLDGDLGAVFGVGFPPFMGGPFRMIDRIGVPQYVDMMLKYRDQNGEQFQPCQLLLDYAKANKRFHPKI
jgi:enoyl-CoA hydratase/long-chain 3-hydroxyacyl-CoA dehydrogenase